MAKTASDAREEKSKLRDLLKQGKTEYECLEELEIGSLAALRKLRASVFSDELSEVHEESAAMLYTRFKLRTEGCITALDAVIDDADTSANARVSAIKAKSVLINDIIVKGQELGVLARAKVTGDESDEVRASVETIRAKAEVALQDIRDMVSGYGDEDYDDLDDEELYFIGEDDDEDDDEEEDEEVDEFDEVEA